MNTRFSTKAGTLASLQGELSSAQVLPQVCLTVQEWRAARDAACARVRDAFGAQLLIVRSSALVEDAQGQSLAGHYESVAGVSQAGLAEAVDRVIASFGP